MLGGRWDRSSVPGCGGSSQAARGSRAARIREAKKRFSCVTTRRRNFWSLNSLGCGLGALAARALCLGVAGFDFGILAMPGLPPGRLPAADLPPAFRVLAVALVPTPRLVPASAPFAEADPGTWSARSGRRASLWLNVRDAHGRCDLPREELGENASTFSPSATKTRIEPSRQSNKP